MKRELLCFRCGSAPLGKFQGEGWKKFLGRLKFACVCDGCGAPLLQDQVAIAQSIFIDGMYFQWEDEFLLGQLSVGTSDEPGHGFLSGGILAPWNGGFI